MITPTNINKTHSDNPSEKVNCLICPKCFFCITCGECYEFGCGKDVEMKGDYIG